MSDFAAVRCTEIFFDGFDVMVRSTSWRDEVDRGPNFGWDMGRWLLARGGWLFVRWVRRWRGMPLADDGNRGITPFSFLDDPRSAIGRGSPQLSHMVQLIHAPRSSADRRHRRHRHDADVPREGVASNNNE
jgi:hypothetical protein